MIPAAISSLKGLLSRTIVVDARRAPLSPAEHRRGGSLNALGPGTGLYLRMSDRRAALAALRHAFVRSRVAAHRDDAHRFVKPDIDDELVERLCPARPAVFR